MPESTEQVIGPATEADLDGIMALLAANQPEQGGTLSADLPRGLVATMMREMPLIVCRRGSRIAGLLIASTREANREVPIIQAMLATYPGGAEAYVYGPICVAAEERGRGLAQALFEELRRQVPGREGILFIRSDNGPSLRAHRKMGMWEVGRFGFRGAEHVVLAYIG